MQLENTHTSAPARSSRLTVGGRLTLLPKPLLIMTAIAAALWLMPGIGRLVYLGLAIYAARGARQTIEALTLLVLVLLGNPLINAAEGDTYRWLVIAAGFGRVIWDLVFQERAIQIPMGPVGILGAFIVWTVVVSVLVSMLPTVSVLKVLTFGVGVCSILICFHSTRHLSGYWRSWFYTFSVFVIGVSLAVFAAGLGYWRTREGFQGVFSHPQILGPVAAIIGAWLTGRFLQNEDRPHPVLLVTMGATWVFVFLSGARTAAFAALGGFMLMGGSLLGSRLRHAALSNLWSLRTVGFAFLLMGTIVVFMPKVSNVMEGFLQKSNQRPTAGLSSDPKSILQASRGALMERSMNNFYESPWVGIGFGVPSNLGNFGSVETVGGIPVSASVEKGFMPTAMLEEVGIIGTGFVLFFLGLISLPVVRWGGVAINWMYWTALLMNGGSAIFFSVGGLGLVMWIVVGFCYAQAMRCKERYMSEAPSAWL